MAHNFQRPIIPYEGTSLQNDNRYTLLTAGGQGIPDEVIEGENNYLIDCVRQLDADIGILVAGNLQGSDNPNNAGFLVTTDGAGNIGWIKIQDFNIVPASISNLSLIPGTITANEIANGTIPGLKIAPNTILASNIAPKAITRNQIADYTITENQIASETITSSEIALLTITAAQIANNTITGNKIAPLTITAAQIAANTITAVQIAPLTITAAQIAANTITAAQIAPLTITAAQIANNTITFAQISNAFTATKAQQVAGASSSVYTSPATQQFHPSAASFWVKFVGSTGAVSASYNVSSVVRNATGTYTITYNNNFSSGDYPVVITVLAPGRYPISTAVSTQSASSTTILTYTDVLADLPSVYVVGFGTLA